MRRFLMFAGSAGWLLSALIVSAPRAALRAQVVSPPALPALFDTADACMACHNGLVTPFGEDVSIGVAWRATMMANAARDPYWQAAVRRETLDHPEHAEAIEDECSICHMPMARTQSRAVGRMGQVFAHLPVGQVLTPEAAFAADGVSCAVCHQIGAGKLGAPESFTGGFELDTTTPAGTRVVYGPFQVDEGRTRVMQSATGFRPAESAHIQSSEVCATCHTLITEAFGPGGEVIGRLPEQVPYLEWRHSRYRSEQSCQSCHMKVVDDPTPIASVLGEPREGFSRHDFLGGNFFMLRMLNRYRTELGVSALPQELDAAVRRTIEHLQSDAARLSIEGAAVSNGRLEVEVVVENLAGHKLPTAYPSRRAWIHLTVLDRTGRIVFESGAPGANGAIRGNDNDDDPARFEPHYREIRRGDDVQIYEAILGDRSGGVTTGLLTAVRYVKDNRLLPHGFDKATAEADIAVHGHAAEDADFRDGGDRVRYAVAVPEGQGPFTVQAELWYQPIAFRWASNLRPYDAVEPRRFVGYYDAMAAVSAEMLARSTIETASVVKW